MLFITDKIQLQANQIVLISQTYPQTKINNTGSNTATLLKSRDGISWDNLTSISPNQEVTVSLDTSFPYIKFEENTTLYFQSETPNHYVNDPDDVMGSELENQLNNLSLLKADKVFVESEFHNLTSILIGSSEYSKNLLQNLDKKVEHNTKIINTFNQGNNLLLNTLLPSNDNPICHRTVSSPYVKGIDVTYDNEVITLSSNSTGNRYALCNYSTSRLDLEPNTSYVFSGYIKSNVATKLYTRWTEYSNRKWNATLLEYQATTEWTRFEFIINMPDKEITGAFLDLVQVIPRDVEVSFKHLKLEKGTVATPYSPATEDIKTILLYLIKKVHELNSTIQANNNSSYSFGD